MYKTKVEAYYGGKYGGMFDDIPFEYAKMFEEFDIILHRYSAFLWNHREDLKAFALMFRNVDIDSCNIIDKAYFLSKSNEIIGYKNYIYSSNSTIKEKLVGYYLKYDILFEMFVKNLLDIDIATLRQNDYYKCTIEHSHNIRTKQFGKVSGIRDLSDDQSSFLISNIKELDNIVNNNNYYIEVLKNYINFEDFLKDVALPYIFKMRPRQHYALYEDCFPKYSEKYCGNKQLNNLTKQQNVQIKDIYAQIVQDSTFSYYSNSAIEALEKKKLNLKEPSDELFRLKNTIWTYISKIPSKPLRVKFIPGESDAEREERREWERKQDEKIERELERERIEKEKERELKKAQLEEQIRKNAPLIKEIDQQISLIKSQKRQEYIALYNAFVNEIASKWMSDPSNVWKHMFEHQYILHNHINIFYKEKYIDFKRESKKDYIYDLMRLSRKGSIVEYVTYMANPKEKNRFENRTFPVRTDSQRAEGARYLNQSLC